MDTPELTEGGGNAEEARCEPIRSYRDLHVWQRSMDLVEDVYRVVKMLPADERYDLGSQMRRAVVSVPANIAEGCGRRYTREFLKHISIAFGSLAELETHLLIAGRLNFIAMSRLELPLALCAEIGRMLYGLERSLQRRITEV